MASKKVFDIIPPKEAKETAPSLKLQKKPVLTKKPAPIAKPILAKSAPRAGLKLNQKALWWPALTIFALLAIGTASHYFVKAKAELEIWPAQSPLSFKTQVSVDKNAAAGAIAGELKTYDCSSSQEFPATGEKSINTKATGTIRVYNAYSTSPQTLIVQTRFVSDDGKLFRIPQKITIPGGHYEGGKLVPGEVDARVEAGEPGEEYNIGPSTFSLPAFAGTSRYTAFYAKSFTSMSGGSKTATMQVSGQDLANAEKVMTEATLANCPKSLTDSLQDYIVEEDAVKSEIIKVEPLAVEGQEFERFTVNIKAQATALVFKQSDLSDFAKAYLLSQLAESRQLNTNSVAVSYKTQSVDLEKGKIVLALEISAQDYPAIDENRIRELAKGLEPDELAEALKQLPEVQRFQLRLWPFWINQTPLETASIIVKIRLD